MSDENEKFTSPTGHAIAKRETDSKPASDYQAALDFIRHKDAQDYMETEEHYHIFKYHGNTIRRALELAIQLSALPKVEE